MNKKILGILFVIGFLTTIINTQATYTNATFIENFIMPSSWSNPDVHNMTTFGDIFDISAITGSDVYFTTSSNHTYYALSFQPISNHANVSQPLIKVGGWNILPSAYNHYILGLTSHQNPFSTPNNASITGVINLTLTKDTYIIFRSYFTNGAPDNVYLMFSNKQFTRHVAFGKNANSFYLNISKISGVSYCAITDEIAYPNFFFVNSPNFEFTGINISKTTLGNSTSNCDIGNESIDAYYMTLGYTPQTSGSSVYIANMTIFNADVGSASSTGLPFFLLQDPIPSTQLINQLVEWSVTIGDDENPSGEILSAFDCDNDGTLDYNWSHRGFGIEFNCTYLSAGIKTAKAWASDDDNYPSQNVSNTNTVNIISAGGGGSGCEGFVPPICTGSCYFFDDFSYNTTVLCNEWTGINRTTTDARFYIFSPLVTDELLLHRISNPINGWQKQTFTFSFDFNIIDDSFERYYYYIYDKDVTHNLAYLYFENGNVVSIDAIPPYSTLIGTYSLGQNNSIQGLVNFSSKTIKYTYNTNLTTTVEFNDLETNNAGFFKYNWLSATNCDWAIDNVRIDYGVDAPANESTPPSNITFVAGASYLTTGNFCAINWTSHRIVQSDCVARGYSTQAEFLQLCLIRACLSDGSTYLFNKAQQDIFKTLVIIIAILLLAPLIVRIATNRR